MALSMIARHASRNKLNCRIVYEGGDIGHQENRAFINLLDIKLDRLTPPRPSRSATTSPWSTRPGPA